MFIRYDYQENSYHLLANWTSAEGKSIVFTDVLLKAADLHQLDASEYLELAGRLDMLTDKLYEQVYTFSNEYEAIPYDPRFRRIALQSLAEINICIESFAAVKEKPAHEVLLGSLYFEVADKLDETVKVYLEDRAYQCKCRERLRDGDHRYVETTSPSEMAFEFEDVLLQMTDLSSQMDCLSAIQRSRLVKKEN